MGLIAGVSLFVFKAGISYGILRTPLSRQIVGWTITALPLLLIVTMLIGSTLNSGVNAFFYTIAATWLPMLLYLFFAALLLALITIVSTASGVVLPMHSIAIGAVVLVCGCTAYGIVNATQPRIVTYEISSPALASAWSGKNIVLFSDSHLGVVRSRAFMQKVVTKVNEQKPDLVLIAGDIIDGPVFNYKNGLEPLAQIKSTFGTIYTPGNHEAFNREPDIFYPIVKNITTTLVDATATVNNTAIIGLDYHPETDTETKARLEKIGFNPEQPSIALLHDPANTISLLDAGVSLVVSGHTHCGQFFPINLIVRGMYKEFTYGLNVRDNALGTKSFAITTCGVGTAMSPLRLGTNPEIVVIHIN